jgi:hypothetical protein
MKNLVYFFIALLVGTGTSFGAGMTAPAALGASRSFIFTEGDVTFSVFPDGEFDFYLNGQVGFQATGFQTQGLITFNSGFNYNPYVQYDDFGAVIQIAHLPVFYDYYGRVSRIGNVHMTYRGGRLYRLGGMRIFYNGLGYYDYHLGYINAWNRVYVYQPFHRYFVRPAAGFCMVYPQPYRRYYYPVRYTYHRPYHNNARRVYASAGTAHQYRERAERSRVYRNDRQVVARREAPVRSPGTNLAGRSADDRTARAAQERRSPARNGTVARAVETTSRSGKGRINSQTSRPQTGIAKARGRSVSERKEPARATAQRSGQQGTLKKRSQSRTYASGTRLASREPVSRTATPARSGKAKGTRTTGRNPR